jgi:HD-GYP domain-containing protein (c-di-GMP phosphodiesterase class II)
MPKPAGQFARKVHDDHGEHPRIGLIDFMQAMVGQVDDARGHEGAYGRHGRPDVQHLNLAEGIPLAELDYMPVALGYRYPALQDKVYAPVRFAFRNDGVAGLVAGPAEIGLYYANVLGTQAAEERVLLQPRDINHEYNVRIGRPKRKRAWRFFRAEHRLDKGPCLDDSGSRMETTNELPDSAYADLGSLVETASVLMEKQPEEGLRIAREVVERAREPSEAAAAIEAWRLLGFAKIAQADYEGALELFLEASEILVIRFGIEKKPSAFLNGMGSAYHHLGLYATAASYLQDAKRAIGPDMSPRSRASTLNNLGLVYYILGERKAAEEELRAAMEECLNAGLSDAALTIRTNLASVLMENGWQQEAKAEYEAIVAEAGEGGAQVLRAAALEGLAACLVIEDRLDEALSLNDQAMHIFRRHGAERDLAGTLVQRAELLLKAGKYEEALEAARVSLASPAAKAGHLRAPLLKVEAQALEALEQWERACVAWREFVQADPKDALSKSHSELLDKSLDEQRIAAATLETQLRRKAEDIARAQEAIIEVLAGAAEAKDDVTGEHVWRSARYVGILSMALIEDGKAGLDQAKAELYASTARLHDIGKLGVPDAILQKPGALNPEEWMAIKEHPLIGERILERASWRDVGAEYATAAFEIVGAHHERWDGSGYPRGLSGEDIPLGGRIMSVADVYDAMRSKRPYKEALPHEETMAFILAQSGSQFDPDICAAFKRCAPDFARIYSAY